MTPPDCRPSFRFPFLPSGRAMRRFLLGFLPLLALSALPAWGRDSLTLGMVLEPPGLDPTAGAASAIREVVYANVFEGLTRIDGEGKIKPALAQSWDVSADGMTYTFHLHQGVRFHDGTPFDCSIVQFSFARAVAPESTNAQKEIFEPIAATECPDPYTAVIHLKHPAADFLFGLGWGDAVMVAPATAATNNTHPVGTGPFRFVRWIKGDRVELTRNPAYWGAKPALAAVTFKFIADPTAAANALLAGDVDAFSNFPAPEILPQLRADSRFAVVIGTTEGKTLLALNEARPPFGDIRVRRALAHAIDRRALTETLMPGVPVTLIGSHYTPNDPDYIDLSNTYPYDPARARALLAEAGVKPGTKLTLTLPPPPYARRGGEVIAAMLAEVGLEVTLVPVEWAEWLDRVFKRADFDMTVIAHTEARDLAIYARDHYYFNYQSPAFRDLYHRYAAITPEAQRDLLIAMQKKLAEDEPNVFLYVLPKIGVWNANIEGLWVNDPIPANDLTAVRWRE